MEETFVDKLLKQIVWALPLFLLGTFFILKDGFYLIIMGMYLFGIYFIDEIDKIEERIKKLEKRK